MPDQAVLDALATLRSLPTVTAAPVGPAGGGFELSLNGTVVPVVSGRVRRAIDEVAWSFSAEIAWTPGRDKALDALVLPYAYTPCTVKLDGELVLTGWLYKSKPHLLADGSTLTLEGASLTADLVDTAAAPVIGQSEWAPCESPWNFANQVLPAMGITPWTDINRDDLGLAVERFDVVQIEPTETFGELFTRLAFQRGMLCTTNRDGNMVLTIAHTGANYVPKGEWVGFTPGFPAAQLIEGKPPVIGWGAEYDGRKRFGKYHAIGQDDLGDPVFAQATDSKAPSRRVSAFTAGDVSKGNIGQVAQWRRSQAVADSMGTMLTVDGWRMPNHSRLWTPNTLVTVQAPSLFLGNATTFLIRATEHTLDGNGRRTELEIVPPETYTGQPVVEKWSTTAAVSVPFIEGGLDV